MPTSIQIIPQKHSSPTMPPPHSYTVMQFKSIQNDDDDDICPVCESECTCKNGPSGFATAAQQPTQPISASSSLPTLKIKLPPRNALNTRPTQKQATVKRARLKPQKVKQMTAGSATVDGTDRVISHRPGPSVAGDGSRSSVFSLRDTSPLTPEPELAPSTSRLKQQAAPRQKKKATPTKLKQSASEQQSRKPSLTARYEKTKYTSPTSSTRRKGKNTRHPSSEESDDNLYDENGCVTRTVMDSDDIESVQFPTFVSAISTTSDNDDSTTSMSDSFESDMSIHAEEEDLILSEEQRAKVRRELLNGEESWHMEKRKWDHLKNNNNWEIRPRKRSVGSDESGSGSSGSDSESNMEVDEEEEEEGDEDDDPDIPYGRGMVTGWQSSDDEELDDVELFFATLSDSSGPGSDADAEDEEDSDNETDNSDSSTMSMASACPLVVTEDWDGRLVFANGLKDGQGVLDVHFEVSATQRHNSIRQSVEVDMSEDAEFDQNDEEVYVSEDDGETTDDMLDHVMAHGAAPLPPLPPRCPTPPVHSINPLSTVSPVVGSRRNKFSKMPVSTESPKPADILANAGRISREGADMDSSANLSRSVSLAATSSRGTSVSSSQSRQPRMGSFVSLSSDPKRRAIVNGTSAVLVSPFAYVGRVRRGRQTGRIMNGNNPAPCPPNHPRQFPEASRIAEIDEMEETETQSAPELVVPVSIGLDDVLDPSFLDTLDAPPASVSETTVDAHLRSLTRWDRVPISTFRCSRATHIDMLSSGVNSSNDGVSYGSAVGRVLRKMPGGTALWQREQKTQPKYPPGSVTVSPIIFPVRDGERAPLIIEFDDPPMSPESHRPKRKEKRKRTRGTTKAPFTTHTPPSIIPPLNL